ncbi:hypothetical protein CXG81DRAFT_27412 [Caulochytrium protostelioides]|uniref:UDP-N-acetylglucosamine diphosphorylase n=1 Tax=Caulochytrium protostelioides TaxID=1555241 RepID=A0A4P9X474_9FUNG|nr:hypothetical protein CXG81DRAFT_27412 [Caulochytrium protostelioides]|eukprot:RKO99844.1 hypothetical protein CXG81DRAFT_27412 [Caulochytrium protostelioides]
MATYETLKPLYEAAGQGHVFTFWDSLAQNERTQLISALQDIDPARVNAIFKKATAPNAGASASGAVEPVPPESVQSTLKAPAASIQAWRQAGMKAIAEGKLAVILLAGGQGTRLGSKEPKGCFDIGLPSGKSLFQLQAERIKKLQDLAAQQAGGKACVIPWYVMTSGPTYAATVAFFEKHHYWGLEAKNVMFFNQGVLPALTPDGKFLMETRYAPAVAPDGNGGIYAALEKQGVMADLERRGIPYVHCYCVDNCLVKVADPVFVGYCIEKGAECGSKVVPKVDPHEQVGLLCRRAGKFSVLEYSEVSREDAEARGEDGALRLHAANIANHFYTTDFLKRVSSLQGELEYHVAKKKVPHVDLNAGFSVAPETKNGIKLELFIFDVFPFARSMAVLEVPREDEFSPLKNGAGSPDGDSPDTSRRDIFAQCARWLAKAGATVAPDAAIELSPAVTYDGEGLDAAKGKTYSSEPTYVTAL